jgi:hypothetical protein
LVHAKADQDAVVLASAQGRAQSLALALHVTQQVRALPNQV